jgi:hypothetical protein
MVTAITGAKVYIFYEDKFATNPKLIVGPLDSDALKLSTDITKQEVQPYAVDIPSLKENDALVVAISAGSTHVFDEGTTIRIPITRKVGPNGAWQPGWISMGDLIGYDGQANTVNVTGTTAISRIWKYVVSAQEEIIFGRRIAENSKMYVDLELTG